MIHRCTSGALRRPATSGSRRRLTRVVILLLSVVATMPTAAAVAAQTPSAVPAPSPSASASAANLTPVPVRAAVASLLIYSGRPDPDWPLTQADLDQLQAIAATLTPVDGLPPEGDLGYKGFRVTGPQGTWRANAGIVTTPDSAAGTALADPDRLVERFLLERGLGTLAEQEVAITEEAIGSD